MKKILVRKFSRFQLGAITISSALFLLGLGQLIPFGWSSPEMQARIVMPGGEPVAGAIVVANWNITGYWNGASLGQLEIAEVVTDKDGLFRIPAWGPRFLSKGVIQIDEPTVRIFKTGFIPLIISNYEGVPMKAADHHIVFRLQNQSIELVPFKGSLVDYESQLTSITEELSTIFWARGADGCYWKRMPRLLLAFERLKIELGKVGAGKTLNFAHEYASTTQPQCGDAKQFFKDYVKE